MAKASPAIRAFNAGVFSVLMEGRTDIDRYPSSLRSGVNCIAAQQGPVLCRSGTEFKQPLRTETAKGILIPFEFNKEQALMLEFSDTRVRLHDDTGLITYNPVAVSSITQKSPLKIDAPTLTGVVVGDSVALSDFPVEYSLNGMAGKVTAKVGTVYTLDIGYVGASMAVSIAKVAKVFEVVHPYATEADLLAVRYQQWVDTLYLQNGGGLYTLSRYSLYDWRFAEIELIDGPFMPEDMDTGTTFSVNTTGNAALNTTGTVSASGSTASGPPSYAFDNDPETFWQCSTDQTGWLEFVPTTPFAAKGYWFSGAGISTNPSYSPKDYSPGTWRFQGWTGSAWVTLDTQTDFVAYDQGRTPFIKLNNSTVYAKYRVDISACTRNGTLKPCISTLAIAGATAPPIILTASGLAGINAGAGFKTTDVGRLIRLRDADTFWRYGKITARHSATSVTIALYEGPLSNSGIIQKWRLGYWSDTTGWPTTALFFDDRFWMGGGAAAPDLMAYTTTGGYSPTTLTFSPTDPTGEVLADSGGTVRLNSAKLGAVQWMQTDEKGLLVGTLNGEWVIAPITTTAGLSATNIRARNSTRRGSAPIDALKVGGQVIFVGRGKRNVYEFAYNYEADGYKAPLMSVYASNLMPRSKGVEQLVYMAEPHSLAWARRADGALLSLTYNRDENVIAWFEHDVGGFVEWLEVMPAPDAARDDLWMIVRRTINGQTRRYIERLKPFWDFGNTIADAFYVDCGLQYVGDPATRVYGLGHLEGEEVMLLADGVPDGPFTVEDASVACTVAASNIVVGKGFDSEGETSRLEAGAQDGTAQGKLKRVFRVGVYLWDSLGGLVGTYDEDKNDGTINYEPIPYSDAPYDEVETVALKTEECIVPLANGYGLRGTVWFKRPAESPLPLNIIRFNPRVNEQDGL